MMNINKINRFSIYIAAITLLSLAIFHTPADAGRRSNSNATYASVKDDRDLEPSESQRQHLLVWKHGTTKDGARNLIKYELDRLRYTRYVRWDGYVVSSYIVRFFVRVLDVRGWITDEFIVIDRCGGRAADDTLKQCRNFLQKTFPGGEVFQ